MKNVQVEEVATAAGAPEASVLPARVQGALGELVGAAKEGLLALSVGVGLGVMRELMASEVEEACGPRASMTPSASPTGTVQMMARSRSAPVGSSSSARGCAPRTARRRCRWPPTSTSCDQIEPTFRIPAVREPCGSMGVGGRRLNRKARVEALRQALVEVADRRPTGDAAYRQ